MKITLTQKTDVRNAWIIWFGLAVIVCVIGGMSGFGRTVTGAYAAGADRWLAGENLYGEGIHGFLYLPQAAIAYIPFAKMPIVVSGVLWRFLTIGGFAGGVWYLTRSIKVISKVELFPLVSIVSLPLLFDSARNGQMTLLLAACMMMVVYALTKQRYGAVAFWCMVGLALKPLMLVMILLVAALYPRTIWRLVLGGIVLLLIPFVFGSFGYAYDQYWNFYEKARIASDSKLIEPYGYGDFFGMLRCFDAYIDNGVQAAVRMLCAGGVLILCLLTKKKWGEQVGAVWLFSFSIVYLMLFNPRTELNTYSMMGAVLGVFASWAFLCERKYGLGVAFIVCVILVTGSYEFTKLITPGRNVWLAPLATIVFASYMVYSVLKDKPMGVVESDKNEKKKVISSSAS